MAEPKKDPRTGKWVARWRDPDGHQRKQSFDKKSAAKAHLAEKESQKARGAYIDTHDPTTVSEAFWSWLDRRVIKPRTRQRYESLIRCHIQDTRLGPRRLVSVLPSEIQSWAVERSQILGPTTMRKLVGRLRSVFADAVLDRKIAANPVVRISLAPPTDKRVIPLLVSQVQYLADAAGGIAERWRVMILVQATLGLRLGEVLGLRVCDIDFLRRTVRIEHQADHDTRRLVDPKTGRSCRVIPLPTTLGNTLAAYLAEHPPSAEVACICPDKVRCSRSRSGLLFHTAEGKPIDHDYYGERVLNRSISRANTAITQANATLAKNQRDQATPLIPAGTGNHQLRHHFASVLLQAGESVIAVAEYLGHENATLVLTTYGHLMPRSEDSMRRAIDAAWDSCAPGVPAGAAAGR